MRLSSEQIARAADIYHTWQSEGTDGSCYEVPELYRSVGIDEIAANNWALTPSKYIEFIDHDLDIDYATEMARIQAEMQEIMRAENNPSRCWRLHSGGLVMGLNKLGDFLKFYSQQCNIPDLTENEISGVNKDREFFEPSKQVGANTSKYKIVPPNHFACNLMHVGRDKILPIALNHTKKKK